MLGNQECSKLINQGEYPEHKLPEVQVESAECSEHIMHQQTSDVSSHITKIKEAFLIIPWYLRQCHQVRAKG